MYRGVNGLLVSYSKRDYSGVWEMEGKFGFGRTSGYPKYLTSSYNP
jgi:hypothetical protein